jgi:hypothetical protein
MRVVTTHFSQFIRGIAVQICVIRVEIFFPSFEAGSGA